MNADISAQIDFLKARLDVPIVLVGPPCAGKTTIGRVLATNLSVAFEDADDRIVGNEGMSIEQIFADRQEVGFRKAETKAINELLNEGFFVLSTGGGAFTQPELQEHILSGGVAVFLRAHADTIYERYKIDVANGAPVRPRLVDDPQRAIADMIAERYPEYNKAHITIDTDQLSVEQASNAIIQGLHNHLKHA